MNLKTLFKSLKRSDSPKVIQLAHPQHQTFQQVIQKCHYHQHLIQNRGHN